MDLVKVKKINEVHFEVITSLQSVHYDLNNYFSFEVPNAKFLTKQKRYSNWDGIVRLYSLKTHQIYCGLFKQFLEWAKNRKYKVKIIEDMWYGKLTDTTSITEDEVKAEMKAITPSNINIRDYQLKGIHQAITSHRALFLSPTGSGKSFIIYGVVSHYLHKQNKILVIVPTTSLVEQMHKDFVSYGMDSSVIYRITAGISKETQCPVVISTWQSLQTLAKDYFLDYNVVIGDEAHLFKAKTLTRLLESAVNAKYRFGFTGTLDGSKTSKIVLEGVFGPTRVLVSTADLVKKKQLSNFEVKVVLLKYQSFVRFTDYKDEADFIVANDKRNEFVSTLANKLKGNTIVFYSFVETHGAVLFEKISKYKETYFVHGNVSAERREQIREIAEFKDDIVIVASYGVFSTGINIKNIHNVIFAFPSKSKIRIFQSIGRSLRLHSNKKKAIIYDIADNINGQNYTLNQLYSRIKYYNAERYNYRVHEVTFQEK